MACQDYIATRLLIGEILLVSGIGVAIVLFVVARVRGGDR